MAELSIDVGAHLRAVRTLYGLSQRELAKRAGVTNGLISLIEQNRVSPSVSSLKKVLDGIPMSLAEFFTLDLGSSPQVFLPGRRTPRLGRSRRYVPPRRGAPPEPGHGGHARALRARCGHGRRHAAPRRRGGRRGRERAHRVDRRCRDTSPRPRATPTISPAQSRIDSGTAAPSLARSFPPARPLRSEPATAGRTCINARR